MSEIIVFGSVNLDLVVYLERSPSKGETMEGKSFETFLGGKGANQAIASSRLGGKVSFMGTIGKDPFGDQVNEILLKEKIDLNLIQSKQASTGTAVINVFDDGENQITYIPGANNASKQEYISDKQLEDSNLIICQMEVSEKQVELLFERSKEKGNLNILNLAPFKKLSDKLISNTDYLVVNESEFCQLIDIDLNDELSIEDIENQIKKKMSLKNICLIVTLGSRGLCYHHNSEFEYIEGIKTEAVDTVGSGDCFVGALAYALNLDQDIRESCIFANNCAALSVTKKGASTSMPTLSEVQRVYKL